MSDELPDSQPCSPTIQEGPEPLCLLKKKRWSDRPTVVKHNVPPYNPQGNRTGRRGHSVNRPGVLLKRCLGAVSLNYVFLAGPASFLDPHVGGHQMKIHFGIELVRGSTNKSITESKTSNCSPGLTALVVTPW